MSRPHAVVPGSAGADGVLDGTFGMELVLDLADCDPVSIRSKDSLAAYARELCRVIEMTPYGEPFLARFGLAHPKTAGYSLVQLIETSSITAHFSEERNRAYVNIFSCKYFDPAMATEFTREFFQAGSARDTLLIRE